MHKFCAIADLRNLPVDGGIHCCTYLQNITEKRGKGRREGGRGYTERK